MEANFRPKGMNLNYPAIWEKAKKEAIRDALTTHFGPTRKAEKYIECQAHKKFCQMAYK